MSLNKLSYRAVPLRGESIGMYKNVQKCFPRSQANDDTRVYVLLTQYTHPHNKTGINVLFI